MECFGKQGRGCGGVEEGSACAFRNVTGIKRFKV